MNKLYIGDNVKVLKEYVGDEVIDLTVTSPPYDDLRTYNGFEWDIDGVIEQLWRVTKQGGVVVWVVGDKTHNGSETGTSFRTALNFLDAGWRLHDTMIYEKNTSSFPARRDGKRYTQIFEYMFVFSKGKIKTGNLICDKPNRWAGSKNWGKNTARGKDGELKDLGDIKTVPQFSPRNNIWHYVVGGGFASQDKIAHNHPAIFPEKLAEDHIISWSNEGDTILDIFGGSGTTAKMAALNNRRFIHIDISEEYVKKVASVRLEHHDIKHEIKEAEK